MIRTRTWRKLKFISYISFLLPPNDTSFPADPTSSSPFLSSNFFPFPFFLHSPLLNKSSSPTLPSFSSSRSPLPSLLSPLLHLPYPPFFLLFPFTIFSTFSSSSFPPHSSTFNRIYLASRSVSRSRPRPADLPAIPVFPLWVPPIYGPCPVRSSESYHRFDRPR